MQDQCLEHHKWSMIGIIITITSGPLAYKSKSHSWTMPRVKRPPITQSSHSQTSAVTRVAAGRVRLVGVCTASHRTACLEDSSCGSVLCCHHLDILNHFWKRALCFHFTVGPMNHIAQSRLKNLLKHITGLTSRKAGPSFVFITRSQVELFLLVCGPRFESHDWDSGCKPLIVH